MRQKIKAILKDERGDIAYLRTFIIFIALNIMLAGFLWYTTLIIQVWDLRTAMTQSLNNTVSSMAAETHQGMREDSLEEYDYDLQTVMGTGMEKIYRAMYSMQLEASDCFQSGDLAFNTTETYGSYALVDELKFVHEGDQIIIIATAELNANRPNLFTTEKTYFTVPIEVSASINTKFDN